MLYFPAYPLSHYSPWLDYLPNLWNTLTLMPDTYNFNNLLIVFHDHFVYNFIIIIFICPLSPWKAAHGFFSYPFRFKRSSVRWRLRADRVLIFLQLSNLQLRTLLAPDQSAIVHCCSLLRMRQCKDGFLSS